MRKLVLSFGFLFFLSSCHSVSGFFRSIKRSIFPSSCRIEVKLDTTDLKYLEDLWDYRFTVTEDTNLRDFASAVQISPKPSNPKTEFSDYVSREFSLDTWNFDPGVVYEIKIEKFYAENDCFLETPVSFKLPVMQRKPSFYLSRENIFESNLNKFTSNFNIEFYLNFKFVLQNCRFLFL